MARLYLGVILAMVAFAANSVLARLALGSASIDAGGYAGVRLLAGAVTLTALVLARRQPVKLDIGKPMRWVAAAALLIYAVAFAYSYLMLGAGTGALILFATVQFTVLGWALSRGDRPSPVAIGGMVVALGAFVYLVSPGLRAPDPLGAILMVAAGVAWAVYTLVGRGSKDPLGDTAENFVLTVPIAAALLLLLIHGPVSLAGVGWAIASGAIASGIGYAIWYSVLPQLMRVQAGIIQLSVPAIAALGGIVFIGEAPTWRLAIATVLILGGVAVAIGARPRRSGRPSST